MATAVPCPCQNGRKTAVISGPDGEGQVKASEE
jgi:hypothetical protein